MATWMVELAAATVVVEHDSPLRKAGASRKEEGGRGLGMGMGMGMAIAAAAVVGWWRRRRDRRPMNCMEEEIQKKATILCS